MKRIMPVLAVLSVSACGGGNANENVAPSHPAGVPPAVSSSPGATLAPPRLRLPDGARPLKNVATLTVVPTEDTFQGDMRIDVEAKQPLPVLWLNADGLTVDRAEAIVGGAAVEARVLPGGRDFIGLAFATPLPAGTSTVHLVYRGELSKTEVDGASRQKEGGDWYVYTHFEPLAARRVFPCFDEPTYKVPWQLTLRVKKGDKAIANAPIVATEDGADGMTTVRFAETKPLPSYLVAFGVGPFAFVDAGKAGAAATPVRIVTPRGKEAWARYAADVSGKVVTLLEKYFGGAYPYEKLDLLAVPLFGGAMENPGLITFRQSLILAKPGMESTGFRRDYASVAAHELAHYWFGDLVTTTWWDDLWLNEAFATWMAPKITEQLHPEWEVPSSRAQSANGAMRADSLATARRIREPITSNDDIKNAFDGITYQKGAAVIGMFERYVGPAAFQRGVQRYMREHAYATATSKDFLAAVSAEAGRDIAPAFSTFLDQPGVPLVATELKCGAGASSLALTASRYLPAGSEGAAPSTPWQVPVCARFSAQGKVDSACTLLSGGAGELPLPGCPLWILPNDAASGYYRTAYDAETLKRLTTHEDALTGAEKVALVGDLAALARANKLDYGALLDVVPTLAKDKNAHVVDAVIGPVLDLRVAPLFDEDTRPKFARFVQSAFGARARALGLRSKPGESEEVRWLRPSLVQLVADGGEDAQLRAECTKLAKTWIADKNAIEPELVGVVLGVAASVGDRALFDAFVADAKKTTERSDRDRLLGAIGQFRDKDLMAAALALTLSSDFDPRESIRILYTLTRLPDGARAAYAFLTSNFDALVARLPRDWGAGAPTIGAALCDDARRTEVESFFKERSRRFVGGPRVLAQSLESMHLCSTFRSAQSPNVTHFLASQK